MIKTRIQKLEQKLKIEDKTTPLTYWTMLTVYKNKSFKETIGKNGWVNINQGNKDLGRRTFDEEPKVKKKLKEIYENVQKDLKADPKAGGSLVWVITKD